MIGVILSIILGFPLILGFIYKLAIADHKRGNLNVPTMDDLPKESEN